MPFRLEVKPDRCQGHAVCLDEAPDEFGFDDHTATAHSLGETLPEDRRQELETVAHQCPTAAIALVDEEDS